ncbi:MAG: hypothetical protein JWP57_4269 [Spirosoma sp.]|nr:hypothetical protein [Spirosoma sp.]
MSQFSFKNNVLHSRLINFVNWVRPEDDTISEISAQADLIRKNISAEAADDGLIVTATPHSGSFAKRTGLRRHMLGHSEVEGQDIDIPIVVKPQTTEGEKLESLLDRFMGYANEAYPNTRKEPTKSSVRLFFSRNVFYDLVPMLSTGKPNEEIIIRSNGDRIKTSIEKHVSFMCSRTKSSDNLPGRVKFNECVRVMKWWREVQKVDGYYLADEKMPSSMLIDLMCAKAYDELSVDTTYAETLFRWFAYLANLVKNRKAIIFSDFDGNPTLDQTAEWNVIDPVSPQNNIVKKWSRNEVDEFATWLEKGRDDWSRAIRYCEDGEDTRSMDNMVKILGNAFKNHCA